MRPGTFPKGSIPWNKGKKGIHLSPETEFKPGEFVGETHPSWRGGVQVPANDCAHIYSGNSQRVRRPRKVYEDRYGKIPKGFVIIHRDGNRYNDALDNLEAISRKELLKRNRSHVPS